MGVNPRWIQGKAKCSIYEFANKCIYLAIQEGAAKTDLADQELEGGAESIYDRI